VAIVAPAQPPAVLHQSERLQLELDIALNGLTAGDLRVECVIGRCTPDGFTPETIVPLQASPVENGHGRYRLDTEPLAGLQQLRLRAYPFHPDLAHPFEMGSMIWA
jgi:hypothetical protein